MGIATKISNDCIVYGDESDVSPHYEVILVSGDKQIRYYPPYLFASTILELDEPKLHVIELSASFVAVWELQTDSTLDDIKTHSADLKEWVSTKTLFNLRESSGHSQIKHSVLYVPLSTSYYWE